MTIEDIRIALEKNGIKTQLITEKEIARESTDKRVDNVKFFLKKYGGKPSNWYFVRDFEPKKFVNLIKQNKYTRMCIADDGLDAVFILYSRYEPGRIVDNYYSLYNVPSDQKYEIDVDFRFYRLML